MVSAEVDESIFNWGNWLHRTHLINELVDKGHSVKAIRRLGSRTVIPLKKDPEWLERSINDIKKEDLKGIDVVIHLASVGKPQTASWETMEKVNIAGSINLIKMAHNAGVKRFVASGSCLEYGMEAERWQRIWAHTCLNPTTSYAASKSASFLMMKTYAIINELEFFYGRIFNAYGEGQYTGNLLPSLKTAAIKGEDFYINGSKQIRDFIDVKIVAKHFEKSVTRKDIKAGIPLVVNIGTGKGMSTYEFARHWWKKLEAKGEIKVKRSENKQSQVKRIVADIKNLNMMN